MYSNLHFYIDLKWEDYVIDPDNYIKNIQDLTNLAYLHRAKVYHCIEQLQEFKENCHDFFDNFLVSKFNQISIILENSIPTHKNFLIYRIHLYDKEITFNFVNNHIFSTIVYNQVNSLLSLSETPGKMTLLSVKSDNCFEKLEVEVINNKNYFIEWLLSKRARNFHLSPKHGENGIGHWPNESPLLCSKDQAQLLLNKSIADFSKKKRFYCFDESKETFIEFFYEGNNPQMQWHGFHVSIEEWGKRVPSSILRYFNK